METLHPSEIDLGLARTKQVAQRLGLLAPNATVVTVAGTNGKGSCVATLTSLLGASGLSCGTYSSPHLLQYNERIRINGEAASDTDICKAFAAVNDARGDISLTYFEFGTLAAFYLFNEYRLPYWVLEVGLGGRLDAVNVLAPTLAIITAIDIDHEQWLGSTRDVIAQEKAGILRDGIPCVCADEHPPQTLLNQIKKHDCDYYQLNRDFSLSASALRLLLNGNSQLLEAVNTHLPKASVAAACQALAVLGVLPDGDVLTDTVSQMSLPGRFHRVEKAEVSYTFDVAHNPAATQYLARRLVECGYTSNIAVVAMMNDKDIVAALRPLVSMVDSWVCCELPHVPRAAQAERLRQILLDLNVEERVITVAPNVVAGLSQAAVGANAQCSPVLVFGSFFTVAAAYEALDIDLP